MQIEIATFPQRLKQGCQICLLACFAVLLIFGGCKKAEKPEGPTAAEHKTAISEAELDPEKQKEVWEAEHLAFELEQRFGKNLRIALTSGNRDLISGLTAEKFAAQIPAGDPTANFQQNLLNEKTRYVTAESTKAVDADGFIDYLMELSAVVEKDPQFKMRVLKLQRDNPSSDIWDTQILVTIVGNSKDDNPIQIKLVSQVVYKVKDAMRIGHNQPIQSWNVKSETVRSSDGYLFEETTNQVGLSAINVADNWSVGLKKQARDRHQIAVADYDQDGFLDIAIGAIGGQAVVLNSRGGKKYVDVTSSLGISNWNPIGKEDCFVTSWVDINNDGYPDLIIGPQLWINQGGTGFEDATRSSGLTFDQDCVGCAIADYDADGFLDLYMLYRKWHDKEHTPKIQKWIADEESGKENQLWRNKGDGTFENVTEQANASGGRGHSYAANWFFYDDDSFPDLYIACDFGRNFILRNTGKGTFEDVSNSANAADFATSMGVVTGDINNDGRTDVYVANMFSKMGRRIIGNVSDEDYPDGIYKQIEGSCAGNRIYLNQEDGTLKDLTDEMGGNEVGWAYAPALVDLDGDGWLDIYATTGFFSADRNEPDG